MASSSDVQLWFWTDYSRGYMDRYQILATDYGAQVMTAFVAVCLTLVSSSVYKIAKSFLVWLVRRFDLVKRDQRTPESWPLLDQAQPDARRAIGEPEPNESLTASNILSGQGEVPRIRIHLPTFNHANPTAAEGRLPPVEVSQFDNTNDHMPEDGVPPGPVQDSQDGPANDVGVSDTLMQSQSSRDAAWNFVEANSKKPAMIFVVTILFGIFVLQTIATIFSAKIATDRAALSSSKHCGIWQFDDYNAGDEAADRDDLYNHRKEAIASQYARNCYGSADSANSLGCSFFYNQSIAFTTESRQRCPFASSELCLEGLYSAVVFDTGYVDASVISINSRVAPTFRRRTTCSPLNMTAPYVRKEFCEDSNDTTYHYYYGRIENKEFTFETSGNPFQWLIPAYSVNTYFSSFDPEYDYWKPLPQMESSSNSTLTILFVSSMHMYHTKASFDPIFPATQPKMSDNFRDPFYYNSDPRARAFACVDLSELCYPDSNTCWSMTASLPPDVPTAEAYWLTKLALGNSNIYDAIKWRLGTALLAQESISQSLSNDLEPNQWEIEAGQLFGTSLARIQYDAWQIASGGDRERPGYTDQTPGEARERLCGIYKFKAAEYTNVNALAFFGIPILAFAIFILSWKAESRKLSTNPHDLIVDVVARNICRWAARLICAAQRAVSNCRAKNRSSDIEAAVSTNVTAQSSS